MRSIKELVGKNAVRVEKVSEYTISNADGYALAKADALRQLYNALPDVEPCYSQRDVMYFVQVQQRLENYAEAGLTVKALDYLTAHARYYGECLRPCHLVRSNSYGIHNSYMMQQSADEVVMSPKDYGSYYAATVARLAKLRGETEAETQEALTAACLLI